MGSFLAGPQRDPVMNRYACNLSLAGWSPSFSLPIVKAR
jgi:hypothetical protein